MALEQGLDRRDLGVQTRTPPAAREGHRRPPAERGATGPVRWLRCDEDVAVLELPPLPPWARELIVASVVAEYRSRHPDAEPHVTGRDGRIRIEWNPYGRQWRNVRRRQLDPRLQPGAYVSRGASLYEVIKRTPSQIVMEVAYSGGLRATSAGDVIANYRLERPS